MFCTLGTTRADAGSAEAFRHIDYDYAYNSAKVFKESTPDAPKTFLLLTAGNANPNACLLYPKVKGEIEHAVAGLGFARTCIFRPDIIISEPSDREKQRTGEALLNKMKPILDFWRPGFLNVKVGDISRSMRRAAVFEAGKEKLSGFENTEVFTNAQLNDLGKQK